MNRDLDLVLSGIMLGYFIGDFLGYRNGVNDTIAQFKRSVFGAFRLV